MAGCIIDKVGNNYLIAYYKNPVYVKQDIIDLGFSYYNKNLIQEYTDIQLQSLLGLINKLISDYPSIKTGIPKLSGVKKSLWNGGFWNMPKPTPGNNSVVKSFGSFKIWDDATGLYPHVGGGGTHSDIAPTPKMRKFLVDNFGYTD